MTPPIPTPLLDQTRQRLRDLHRSASTEKLYLYWIRFFIRWSGARHPQELETANLEGFLNMLANERQLSTPTQKQALSALQFLYQEVLALDMPCLHNLARPKVQARISCVLTTHEVSSALAVLDDLNPQHGLMAKLLYGTGMRITEAARLRVKDLDFDQGAIVIRQDRSSKERLVMLPNSLRSALEAQLQYSQALWLADREAGVVGVAGVEMPTQKLPTGFAQQDPPLSESWPWFWVFPLATLTADPHSKVLRRQPVYVQTFRRALASALRRVGVTKPDNPHTLRHTFAAHLLQRGRNNNTRCRAVGG